MRKAKSTSEHRDLGVQEGVVDVLGINPIAGRAHVSDDATSRMSAMHQRAPTVPEMIESQIPNF